MRAVAPKAASSKVELEVVAEVGARGRARGRAGAPPKISPKMSPKMSLMVAAPAEAGEGRRRALPPAWPKLVVAGPLLRIGEDVVGLGDLLEALLGGLVARVLVGVELVGELAVGGLELLAGRASRATPSTS